MAAGTVTGSVTIPPSPVTNPDTAASRTWVATSRRIASSRSPPAVMRCSSADSTAVESGPIAADPELDDLRDEPFPECCERAVVGHDTSVPDRRRRARRAVIGLPLTGAPAGVARWSSTRLSPAAWSTASSRSGHPSPSSRCRSRAGTTAPSASDDELSVRLPSAPLLRAAGRQGAALAAACSAPHLPLPIPSRSPGVRPTPGYPYPWSVYRWLDGRARVPRRAIGDLAAFASTLAGVPRARCAASTRPTGPPPGAHNFFRGGPLRRLRAARRSRAVDTLGGAVPRDAARAVWEAALATTWDGDPVWVHGDVAAGQPARPRRPAGGGHRLRLVRRRRPRLRPRHRVDAPAGASRAAFRAALRVDDATWARGRGWALWKALITLGGAARRCAAARHTLDAVLADHARES